MMALLILSGLWLGAEAQSRPPCNPDTPAGRAAAGIVEAAIQAKARDAAVFEQAARQSAQRVSQATDCLARATEAVNQQIPNFGGGMLGALSSMLTQNLANQACSVVGQAQQQVQMPGMQMPGVQIPNVQIPGVQMPGLPQQAPAPGQGTPAAPAGVVETIGNALSRLF